MTFRTPRSQRAKASRRKPQSLPMRIATGVVWVVVAADIALIGWILLTSLRDGTDILNHPFGVPTHPEFGNYSKVFSDGGFGQAALNSVLVAVLSSVLAVVVAAPCAYALARRRNRVSGAMSMTFAMGLGVPGQVMVVPLFIGMAKANLDDSQPGLILVYLGLAMPFTVYLLTGFFSGIPQVLGGGRGTGRRRGTAHLHQGHPAGGARRADHRVPAAVHLGVERDTVRDRADPQPGQGDAAGGAVQLRPGGAARTVWTGARCSPGCVWCWLR